VTPELATPTSRQGCWLEMICADFLAGAQALHREILERDGWRCQACGSMRGLEVQHIQRRSQLGGDSEGNPITCAPTAIERFTLDKCRFHRSHARAA